MTRSLLKKGGVFICFALFFAFRINSIISKKQEEPLKFIQAPLQNPLTLRTLLKEHLSHPWLVHQNVESLSEEILQDIEIFQQLCAKLHMENPEQFSDEEIRTALVQARLDQQQKIPFSFPEGFYNLFAIAESFQDAPIPFKTVKRLYLGKNEENLSEYLDVRVFRLTHAGDDEKVLNWYVEKKENSARNRTIYFYSRCVDGVLYVAHLESSSKFFEKHLDFFQKIR